MQAPRLAQGEACRNRLHTGGGGSAARRATTIRSGTAERFAENSDSDVLPLKGRLMLDDLRYR